MSLKATECELSNHLHVIGYHSSRMLTNFHVYGGSRAGMNFSNFKILVFGTQITATSLLQVPVKKKCITVIFLNEMKMWKPK